MHCALNLNINSKSETVYIEMKQYPGGMNILVILYSVQYQTSFYIMLIAIITKLEIDLVIS